MDEPSPVSGPACAGTAPNMDITITSYIRGKPPHETFVADLSVRNPLAVPVWLLYDVGDSFPSIVNSVVLSRTIPGSAAQVWSFSGDGSFEAVRIPGEARLVLRDAGLSSYDQDLPLALVFASRVTVGGQPAEEWLGWPGLLPTRGDFNLTPPWPAPKPEYEWHVDSLNAPAVHVDVLCVSHVNRPAYVAPTP